MLDKPLISGIRHGIAPEFQGERVEGCVNEIDVDFGGAKALDGTTQGAIEARLRPAPDSGNKLRRDDRFFFYEGSLYHCWANLKNK